MCFREYGVDGIAGVLSELKIPLIPGFHTLVELDIHYEETTTPSALDVFIFGGREVLSSESLEFEMQMRC